MSNKDIEVLMEMADAKLEEVKKMSKKEAILSLNRAGILTKTGKFTKPYAELEELFKPSISRLAAAAMNYEP